MTDTDKLKRLAEEARETAETVEQVVKNRDYIIAATPSAILALIAERDEAVALLREFIEAVEKRPEMWGAVFAFLARIDAKGSE